MTNVEIAKHLAEFFKDEPHKITLWWFTENLNFGGVTPAWFYLHRPGKFAKWIRNAKELNKSFDKKSEDS